MPVWLIALQTIIPLIKWGIETLVKHPPAQDAPQVMQDAHAKVLGSMEHLHKCMNDVCEAHK